MTRLAPCPVILLPPAPSSPPLPGQRRAALSLRRRAPWLGALVLLPLVASCAGTPLRPTATSSPGEALFNGRTRPEVNCYSCHNGDGTGTWRGPDLTKRVPGLTDPQIVRTIDEGPGLMPAFKGKIDARESEQVIAWLRQRFPHIEK